MSAIRCAAVATARRSSYLTWKFFVGYQMHIILRAIFSILVFHFLNSTTRSFGGALCAADHPARYICIRPRTSWNDCDRRLRFKPIGSCNDTLDSTLEYQLPPGYDETPINEVEATCNKTIQCSGIEFKCVGATRPYPMSFMLSQPMPWTESRRVVGRFPEGIGTFHHRLHALVRRF